MWVFILNVASTLYMVGLIWFVQVVHYPLHAKVGPDHFLHYQQLHMNWTGYVVGPPMLIEAGTTVYLMLNPLQHVPNWYFWIGGLLLLFVWASTGLLQVPIHNSLMVDGSSSRINMLVNTNWIRTVCWSLRGILVVVILHSMLTVSGGH